MTTTIYIVYVRINGKIGVEVFQIFTDKIIFVLF